MSGVGFVGAAIIFEKDNTEVARLTATTGVRCGWVGIAVGYGYHIIGGMGALLELVIQDGVFFFLKLGGKQVCSCTLEPCLIRGRTASAARARSGPGKITILWLCLRQTR